MEETEHLSGWRQQNVAKIVQCGETRIEEGRVIAEAAGLLIPSRVCNCKTLVPKVR